MSNAASPCLPPGTLRTAVRAMASAGDGNRVRVSEVLDTLGRDAFAPVLLMPALVALSPATVVVGLATVCGLSIALLSAQIVARRRCIWLPGFVLSRRIDRTRLEWIARRLDAPLAWIERRGRRRLTALNRWPLAYLPASICTLVGLAMPAMELVPLSATTGGAAVALMVVGLILDDGLIVLAGMGFALAVAALAATAVGAIV